MRRWLPHPVTALLVVVLAGVGALAWWLTTGPDAFPHRSSSAQTHVEEALTTARQTAINSASFDYRALTPQFSTLTAELTGSALTNFQQEKSSIQQQFTAQKVVSTAQVLDAAILPGAASTKDVQAIIALDITYTANGGQTQLTSQLMRLDMVDNGKGWVAQNITPIISSVS